MKRALISAVVLSAAMGMAISNAQGAVYVDTGFESPAYSTGDLVGQNGWGNATSASTSSIQVVTGGGSLPAAPEGSQYVQMSSLKNSGSYVQLQWNGSQVTENFVVDVKLAFSGSPSSTTVFYIQDAAGGSKGAIFGFDINGGEIKLAGRNGDNYEYIDADPDTSGVNAALSDTFYRFVATVRPADAQYDLEVYDDGGNLLGQLTDLASRGGVNEFSWLRASTGTNIGATLYFDDLTIASVPEPTSFALLGCAGILLCLRRR